MLETGNNNEAKRKARSAYLIAKESAYANFAYAVVLLRIGEYEESLEKFENTLKLDSNYLLAYIGKSEAYLNLKLFDKAFETLENSTQEVLDMPETFEIETKIAENLLAYIFDGSQLSNDSAHSVFKYCNKILERYNNDKILELKNNLLDKFQFEAN